MDNLSKGLVIAIAAVAMLSALMVAAVSIPSASAALRSPPTTPPNTHATNGCGKSLKSGHSTAEAPFCP